MSTSKHRQPIINWSSVVLLSTLLLSPMTAASVLHILAQAFPHAFSSALPEDVDCPAAARTPDDQSAAAAPVWQTPATPRRDNDEQEALRRAVAKVSRLRGAVRFDTDPHALLRHLAAGAAVAILAPRRTAERGADSASPGPLHDWLGFSDALACTRIIGPTPSRAPPA